MCQLTPQQKQFIIEFLNNAFNSGTVRGPAQGVAQTAVMAAEIIRQLSEPEQGKAAEKPK